MRNVRVVSRRAPPSGPGVRAVTVTCFLCTSTPPTHRYKISMRLPSCDTDNRGCRSQSPSQTHETETRARGNNLGYQGRAPASFLLSGAQHQAVPTTASDTRPSFTHLRGVPPGTIRFLLGPCAATRGTHGFEGSGEQQCSPLTRRRPHPDRQLRRP